MKNDCDDTLLRLGKSEGRWVEKFGFSCIRTIIVPTNFLR